MNPNKHRSKKKDKEIKDKPLMAYINARVSEINDRELTDQEYEIEKNRQAINGVVAYLEYKFNEQTK